MRLFSFPALLILCGLCANLQAADRPNILIIIGDDMGYNDVGFHGGKEIPTPHLDALAAHGVRFTSGYVNAPYCSPTRAALLTGRAQNRFGHEFNPSTPGAGLPQTETTVADRLKAAGYRTGLIGKWHLGNQPQFHPQQRGFEEFFGFLGGAHSYFSAKGLLRGNEPVEEKEYLTDALGREACAFIERHKAEPWFLYLAFNAVHTPMHADEGRLAKFSHIPDPKRRTYAAMMAAMDENIGRVRQCLADSGQEKETLIIFFSDNGGPSMPGTAQNGSDNTPLRGSKRTTLEGGIRVPFLVAWPGQLKPAVFSEPVISYDITATSLAAAGVQAQAEWKLEGVNLLPFLRGEKAGAPHQALFWRFGEQMAVRAGDWKLVRYDGNADTRTGERNQPLSAPKLYNLKEDEGESRDRFAELPEKLKELQVQWNGWNAANAEPLWDGEHLAPKGAKAGKKKKAGAKAASPAPLANDQPEQ